jgi:hypothetical protein
MEGSVMSKAKKEPPKMNLRDNEADTESGMLLSILADESGEDESAMVLNSLFDDPEALKQDAERFIRTVEQAAEELDKRD